MPTNKIVSFIIPTFNSERTIEKCIRSILSVRANRMEKEIIVVDDRSTDKTVEIAKKLGVKVIVKRRHSGVPESLNMGIQRARGELLALVDSDAYLSPDWLEKGLEEINSGADGVHPHNITRQPDHIHRRLAKLSPIKFFLPTLGDASLVKREVFEKIGLFNDWFAPIGGQDVEIALRAFKAGFKIVQSTKMTHYHDFAPMRGLRNRLKRMIFYQSGRVKAWMMHLDHPFARISLINDWVWFLLYPGLLLLRKLLVLRLTGKS